MRITGSQVGGITPAQLAKIKKAAPGSSTEPTQGTDEVVLSKDISAISTARNVIAATPDVRQEKIAALQQQIRQGTYHVPAEDIADKMAAEARLSKILGK